MPRLAKVSAPRAVTVTQRLFKRWMYRCVLVPKKTFKAVPAVAPLPVVVTVGGERFESTLTSNGPNDYLLIVPMAYLRALGLSVGDRISLSLAPDLERKAPPPPPDFQAFLRAQPALAAEYERMTVASKRQTVKYVDGVINEASRQTRFEITAERLRQRIERRARKARN
jgi:hypothetical protein